jgi:hypothetical protein
MQLHLPPEKSMFNLRSTKKKAGRRLGRNSLALAILIE